MIRTGKRLSKLRLEALEDRSVPAVHTWDAGGGSFSWSDAGNWDANGPPTSDEPGGTFVVFPINDSTTFQDIPNLRLAQIVFSNPGTISIQLDQPLTFDNDATNPNIANDSGTNRIFNGSINQTGNLPIAIAVNGGTLTIDSAITGTQGMEKQGAGTLRLGGTSTYEGITAIADGGIVATSAAAFGASVVQLGFGGFPANIDTFALVDSTTNLTIANTFNSLDDGGTIGTADNGSAPVVNFTGQIFANSGELNLQPGSQDRTTFSGQITGTGSINATATAPGRRIVLDNDSAAAPNNFEGGVRIENGAVLQLTVSSVEEQIPDGATVTLVGAGSTLRLFFMDETIAGLQSTAGIGVVESFQNGPSTLILNSAADHVYGGSFSQNGTSTLSLVKQGTGVQTLLGPIDIGGTIQVTNGDLVLESVVNSGVVTASGDGGIRGTGTINNTVQVQSGGVIFPGTAATPGVLSTDSVTFAADSFFAARVDGVSAGDFDVLSVTGAVTLGSANLVILDGAAIAVPITIIDNDGTDAIGGTFLNLPEGGIVTGVNNRRYRISYVGGTGNDVTLSPVEPYPIHGPMITVGGDVTQGGIYNLEPVGPGGTYEDTGFFKPFGVVAGIGMRTYAADVDGDGQQDTVAVTGPGVPIRVMVMSGIDNTTVLVPAFDPFGGDFKGGGFVSGGDFDGDGREEFVVTPDQGGGPRVSIFRLNVNGSLSTIANFLGIDDDNFRGGARAAVGDIDGDGVPEVAVGAGFLGGPRTAIFRGSTIFTTRSKLVGDFLAFPGSDAETLRNGIFLAVGDINGDGFADLIAGGGPGGAPRVYILSGALITADNVAGAQANPIANFFVAGNAADRGGIRLNTADADGDNRAELVTGSGEGSPARVRIYKGSSFTGTGEPTLFQELAPLTNITLAGGVFVG